MRQYPDSLPEQDWETLCRRHPDGDTQIRARTLIVQGDRDPFYPVEISVEMARAIPQSSLWIVPNAGHGPIGGERWPEFLKTAARFLREWPRPPRTLRIVFPRYPKASSDLVRYQDKIGLERPGMEHLAQKAAELALRLAAQPAEALRRDVQTLDAIEQLATQVLKEVSAVRLGKTYAVGETSGAWRAMAPIARH